MQVFFETFWMHFCWLCADLIRFYPVTAALAINFLVAVIRFRRTSRTAPSRRISMIFTLFLSVPIVLAIGVLGYVNPDPLHPPPPNIIGFVAVGITLAVASLLGLYFLAKMEGGRWIVVSTLFIVGWMLLLACFTAYMALTGQWL